MMAYRRFVLLGFLLMGAILFASRQTWAQDAPAAPAAADTAAQAADPPVTVESLAADLKTRSVDLDTVWVLVAAFLVFWMQAGFALVETGLTRAKNTVNILMKNMLDFCFASVVFFIAGFAIMFGTGNAFMGTSGFLLSDLGDTFSSLSWSNVSIETKFFFQLVFAGTAATIVSGSMAERTKFSCYLIYSVFITLIIYPIAGHWIWGGGWLSVKGFYDFAGSTVVHSVGGWIALCGAIVVGPRLGKYGPGGKVNAIPGHNFPLMVLGVFILWLGWFGFNPGSTMMASGMGSAIAHIVVATNAAAATGTIGALVTAKLWFGKWDASMAGNGCLAGLVAITAPCAFVSNSAALVIGLIGGILVVFSVVFIDRTLKVDDPVGAISVHLVNGIWGTLALGLFSQGDKFGSAGPLMGLFNGGGMQQLFTQMIGIVSVGAWCLVTGFVLFGILKAVMGLRVSAEEELRGLDLDEHGMDGYPDFVLATHSLPTGLGGSSSAAFGKGRRAEEEVLSK